MTLTIVSGAAPGPEQGAIEAAVNLALHWQGWAARDHLAALEPIYRAGLQPTSATDLGMVRRLNCQDADGVLVFSPHLVLIGLAAFIDRTTEQMGRAFLHVTLNRDALDRPLPDEVRDHIRNWIRSNELARVYVTGPSEDNVPGIQHAVRDALVATLEPFAVEEIRATTHALSLIERSAVEQAIDECRYPGPIPSGFADPNAMPDSVASDAIVVPQQTYDRLERALNTRPAMALEPDDGSFTISPAEFRRKMLAGEVRLETIVLPVTVTNPRAFDPPEGLDELQRAHLDASIREAERDIREAGPPLIQCPCGCGLLTTGTRRCAGCDRDISLAHWDDMHDSCGDCADRAWERSEIEPPAPGDPTA